jgi:hypothetical protein
MKYTKEERTEYFKQLRNRWKISKEMAENDELAKALFREIKGNFSYYSFYFTLQDMRKVGYQGLPYIDCKTFNGWKETGFKVKKGEHSKIDGIVWLEVKSNKETEDDEKLDVYPKLYHLFHRSQVEPIK